MNITRILDDLEDEVYKTKYTNATLEEWNRFYVRFHRNRYKKDIHDVASLVSKNDKILEVGSLPCHTTYLLAKLGFSITGVDLNPGRLRGFIINNNLKILKCDIENQKLPFTKNAFDLVILNEVFEHLRINPIHTLREIRRVLKKNGHLILTTPNLYSLQKIIMFNIGMDINDPYTEFEKLELYGHMGHIREYSTSEVKKFLEKTGFKVVGVEYRQYNKFMSDERFSSPFLKIAALILDFAGEAVPKLRPFQVVISVK